ncbi:MAG: hypothetical protein LBN00_03805 [Oscillospiraceae bacterium]|nr:hypothetical protein [Oscillospiraceae bacterium]
MAELIFRGNKKEYIRALKEPYACFVKFAKSFETCPKSDCVTCRNTYIIFEQDPESIEYFDINELKPFDVVTVLVGPDFDKQIRYRYFADPANQILHRPSGYVLFGDLLNSRIEQVSRGGHTFYDAEDTIFDYYDANRLKHPEHFTIQAPYNEGL